MHNATRLFGAVLSAVIFMDAPLFASASMDAPCEPVPFEADPSVLQAATQAFCQMPTVATLEEAMEASRNLLAPMLEANQQELDAACPMLLSQWRGAFEGCYQTQHATLQGAMSLGSLYPDAFVQRYSAGSSMAQAIEVVAAIRRGDAVASEARLASARFFVLVAHLEKMGAISIQTFFEKTLEHRIAPIFEGAVRRFNQRQERDALNMLTQFDTLEGVNQMFWLEVKSLPMGLRSLLLACGQDKDHPEFSGRVALLKNKHFVPLVTGGTYPDELESIAQSWQDVMAMDRGVVDASRAALYKCMKECEAGDVPATRQQLETCVSKYTFFRKSAGEVMDFFWQVEKRLFETLYHERFPREEGQHAAYAPLQETWGKETGAAALIADYKKVLHQRSVLTIGEVRTLLGHNLVEDAQEEEG